MDYFNHPAMSRSKLVELDKITPYKWWYKHEAQLLKQKSTKALNYGSAFHCYVLEPHKFDDNYAVAPNLDKRTKDGKKNYQEFIANCGYKKVLSNNENTMLSDMLFSLSNHPAKQMIKSCDLKEEEFYFKLEGIPFKSKVDCIDTQKHVVFDIKTCRESFVNGKQFAQEMINYHCAEQVFIYSEAYRQKYGTNPKFYFVCIEKQSPFEVQIWDASCLYEYGYKKTLELIDKYKCLKEKYGDKPWIENKKLLAELPKWAESYLEEELALELDGVDIIL